MSVLIVLDKPDDRLMLKKLIAEVIHDELKAASESRHSEMPDDRMLIDQVCKFLGLSKSTAVMSLADPWKKSVRI